MYIIYIHNVLIYIYINMSVICISHYSDFLIGIGIRSSVKLFDKDVNNIERG